MTLKVTASQVEITNAVGTTKFNGDDRLMYLRYTQSGTNVRVPNQPTGQTQKVWTSYFDPEVRISLGTTIDTTKDVIQLRASLTEVQNANFVDSYNGAMMPLSTPLQIGVSAAGPVDVAVTFLTAGITQTKLILKLNTNMWEQVSSSHSTATRNERGSLSGNMRARMNLFDTTNLITPIVDVDWTLNVWRYA
jgi:hypothetical protein